MQFESVIFDWDNTIVDTSHLVVDAINKTFLEIGEPNSISKEQYALIKDPFDRVKKEKYQEAKEIYQIHINAMPSNDLIIFQGAENLFQKLCSNKVYLAIASNKQQEKLENEVDLLGLGKYFQFISGSGKTTRDKPFPDILLRALDGRKAENSVMIGDSSKDWYCARDSGVAFIKFGDRVFECDPIFQAFNYTDLDKILC